MQIQTPELKWLEKDTRNLERQLFVTQNEFLPKLKNATKYSNEIILVSVNYFNLIRLFKCKMLELVKCLDENIGALNNMKAPRGHGSSKFQNKQYFHGQKGSINDKLSRLKSRANAVIKELDNYKFQFQQEQLKKAETQAYELLDPVDAAKFQNHDIMEYYDFINATVGMIALVITALRQRKLRNKRYF